MKSVLRSRLVSDYYGLPAVMLGGRVYPIGSLLPNLQAIRGMSRVGEWLIVAFDHQVAAAFRGCLANRLEHAWNNAIPEAMLAA
jgi:hypothetical protein